MATESGPTGKECVLCGRDCAGRPRLKDSVGRYYCRECCEKAKAKKKAAASADPSAKRGKKVSDSPTKGAKTAARIKSQPPARSKPKPVSGGDDGLDVLADAVSGTEAAPVIRDNRQSCPACHEPMAVEAVVCMSCGFNRQSGQRVATRVDRPVVRGSGAFGERGFELPAVLYQPWIAGAVPLLVFGVLYCLAWTTPETVGVYEIVVNVFGFVLTACVLVSAFHEGIGTGLLCLCLPFYILYFVYFRVDSTHLVYAYTVALVANLASLFLPGVL